MEIENVVENAESVVKANKVDAKGLAVILGVATGLAALTTYVIKKIRETKATKAETKEVKPEDVVTEAEA